MAVVLNLLVFVALCGALALPRGWSLSRRIFAGLVAGVVYGLALQLVFPAGDEAISTTLDWVGIIGSAYISLLRMLIIPLVLVMMIAALLKLEDISALGRIGGTIVGILIGTTIIAALVGVGIANAFSLSVDSLVQGELETRVAEGMARGYEEFSSMTLPQMLAAMVPGNIFTDLSEERPTSIIAVVIFGVLLGSAMLTIGRKQPERAESVRRFVDTAQAVVLQLVRMVMALTPWGILALMAKVVASSDAGAIADLALFIVASYLAIAIMFAVHAALLLLTGGGVVDYFRKVWPVLVFAFGSRSSAATIPLNVETQVEKLGVTPATANISASFGATIGQNGCAGIYPAMLAVMVAPSMGVDPLSPVFIAGLVAIIAIGSFGVAGVGGGATMAAFIVLPAVGFPITIAALLISIEPLIDMARTALNVNGAMTAGVLTHRLRNTKDSAQPAPAE